MCSDLMDRPFDIIANERTVGTDLGNLTTWGIKFFARAQHAAFDQLAKWDTWLRAFGCGNGQSLTVELADLCNARCCNLAIAFFALNPDEFTTQHLGNGPCRASSKERVQNDVARIGRADQHTVQQAFGFLRMMRLTCL